MSHRDMDTSTSALINYVLKSFVVYFFTGQFANSFQKFLKKSSPTGYFLSDCFKKQVKNRKSTVITLIRHI